MKQRLFLVLIFIELSFVLSASKAITIFIVGDSTAANKDTSGGKLERGWGQLFQNYFNKNLAVVDNHARNGRSSKSFMTDGLWAKVTKLIKKGDYVLIQFGHNDEKKGDTVRYTQPGSTFDQYLTKYVTETKKLGGIPVLMSPVVRCSWKNGVLVDTHGEYRKTAKNLAKKLKVSFVDANSITEKLEKSLGEKGSQKLHMIYKPGQVAAYPKGINDSAHYNEYGAKTVARLLADGLTSAVSALAKYRK
jgi:pectinesterase